MEQTITIKIEVNGRIENSKKKESDMDDSRMTYSPYARFYDVDSPEWNDFLDSEARLFFLRTKQEYANDILRKRGYLFLNEVYDMLGLARSKAGQVVGWVYNEKNPIGDNYVDFYIYNPYNSDFVNGSKTYKVLLDFNVDGCILDYI